MVFGLSRSQITPRKDPHDWNSWDHYRTIHEIRLSEHPFVVKDTLAFSEVAEGELLLSGFVMCRKSVKLEVEKWFDIRYYGNMQRVRCHTYVYIGWLRGEHLLLKYHNLHQDPDEYIHRVYDPTSGDEVLCEILERYQFPTLSEVLDELETIAQDM